MEKFCLGFYTVVPPMVRTDSITADTGCDPPDPPLSPDEMEAIALAAKIEFLRVMRRRAEAKAADEKRARALRRSPKNPRARILSWVKVDDPGFGKSWISVCDRYRVWVQARPRHEPPYYGAMVNGPPGTPDVGKWLTDTSTFAEAKEICEEHAKATAAKSTEGETR